MALTLVRRSEVKIKVGLNRYMLTRFTDSTSTALFITIEPVDGAGAGRLLVGVLPVRLYRLRHTDMLAAHNRVNVYDARCKELESVRASVEREFVALKDCRRRVEELEEDQDALPESLTGMLPEAVDDLTGEEKGRIY